MNSLAVNKLEGIRLEPCFSCGRPAKMFCKNDNYYAYCESCNICLPLRKWQRRDVESDLRLKIQDLRIEKAVQEIHFGEIIQNSLYDLNTCKNNSFPKQLNHFYYNRDIDFLYVTKEAFCGSLAYIHHDMGDNIYLLEDKDGEYCGISIYALAIILSNCGENESDSWVRESA